VAIPASVDKEMNVARKTLARLVDRFETKAASVTKLANRITAATVS
jgi:hypothetical protein